MNSMMTVMIIFILMFVMMIILILICNDRVSEDNYSVVRSKAGSLDSLGPPPAYCCKVLGDMLLAGVAGGGRGGGGGEGGG